jgi:hypothetical protein
MAVLHALTSFVLVAEGLCNRNLRGQVVALLGLTLEQYTAGKMTYDLRRLRLRGPHRSHPHAGPPCKHPPCKGFTVKAVFPANAS